MSSRFRSPVPVAEAIDATTPLERRSLEATRAALAQALRGPVVEAAALMPDACPAGPGAVPVGSVLASPHIHPGFHSSDICCSLLASVFEAPVGASVSEMMDRLVDVTHFGPGGRPEREWIDDPVLEEPVWDNPFLAGQQRRAAAHLGTQGDGNHFAFIGRLRIAPEGLARMEAAGHEQAAPLRLPREWLALVTHHGSRALGAAVFRRGQDQAIRMTDAAVPGVPRCACWIPSGSPEGEAYWQALQYVSRWTRRNHEVIHRRFHDAIGARARAWIGCEHNFVWRREIGGRALFLHGKGATPAWADDAGRPLLGIIPLNMAQPVLLCLGSNNTRYFAFAPHGAGRNQSRADTTKSFLHRDGTRNEEKFDAALAQATAGIDVRWFGGRPDIAETPIGYKDADSVRGQIARFGLAEIIGEIAPLGCVMAGEIPRWWNRKDVETPKQRRQREHRAERRREKQSLRRSWEEEME